ncbi:MAG TPA: S-layer homology domain-containing protein [Bacillus sp. (in: firmicutes)]|nr:S-layer homology domain-containing protein [Bacillus sp. (in: firmicutes)]
MKTPHIFIALLVSFGAFFAPPAFAADKTLEMYYLDDVDYEHWAYDELERFVYADIIDGKVEYRKYSEDEESDEYIVTDSSDEEAFPWVIINPEGNVTRAQFTKMLVNAMNLSAGDMEKSFSDVKSADWYYDYIHIASSQGIVNGKMDGTFRPNDKITRDQMAVMIYRAFAPTIDFSAAGKAFQDVEADNFAYEAVVKTAAKGIIKGHGDVFKPRNWATRAQAVVMIDRALHQEPGVEEDKPVLTQIVDRNIKEEMTFTAQQDVDALKALYHETAMGYQLAYSVADLEMLDGFEEFDGTFTMEQVGEHSSHVVSMNKRLAEVRVDGLRYKVSMTAPDMSFSMTVDTPGTAYLKKHEDGKWKIYNFVPDEEDVREDWEEKAAAAIN